MQDTMFKQSIRLFFRVVLWIVKIIVTPIMSFVFCIYFLFILSLLTYHWTVNNSREFGDQVSEMDDLWKAVFKWFKI